MKKVRSIFLPAVFFPAIIFAQSADEVVQRSEDLLQAKSSKSDVTMRIERPSWSRELSMRSYSLRDDYAMIYILEPVRDRGTSFLKRETELWQWVPNISRVIKIPPSMMTQSWMGSDFTNDDLVRGASVVNDYTHSFLSDTVSDGADAWRVQLIPRPAAPVVWSKVIMWVTKGDYIRRRVEFFDERGALVSVLVLDNVKKMGGRTIPTRMTMTPQNKPGYRTVMEYNDAQFNISINESFFSQQNMKQIR
ncbi:MAG: outer membrane lipoprotein-sorting protein [Chitinispirillales bacterium]|jgi:outer membrane lipoprotein-sorting protein|nr:outer membrane lipoprotein-sorting protein [Chitinispirillales bacterium]